MEDPAEDTQTARGSGPLTVEESCGRMTRYPESIGRVLRGLSCDDRADEEADQAAEEKTGAAGL